MVQQSSVNLQHTTILYCAVFPTSVYLENLATTSSATHSELSRAASSRSNTPSVEFPASKVETEADSFNSSVQTDPNTVQVFTKLLTIFC